MRSSPLLLSFIVLAACSGSGDAAVDMGRADLGPHDAGGGDAGAVDSGGTDAGATDLGATDAGDVDSGASDLGAADAGADLGGGNVGDPCGARLGDTCVGGTWCRWALGDLCGAADAPGHCAYPTNPTDCTSGAPVCASDGMTYSNECLANAVMQSACSTGPCTP